MKHKSILTLLLFLFSLMELAGQDRLILEHKSKASRKKYLDPDREYDIRTGDTLYSFKTIAGFTDTTISIPTQINTGRDTTYTYTHRVGKNKDTTYTYKQAIYREDTIVILIKDIQTIKKDWFKNRQWLQPFGWFALGAAMGVVMLPVAAIDKGKEGVKEWALFEAILIGISAPPIFIGTRKTKYDLVNKWTLKVEQ